MPTIIENNPHLIGIGEVAILDKEFANSSKVVIHDFTPAQTFATVYSVEDIQKDTWQVMTNRLSPLIK